MNHLSKFLNRNYHRMQQRYPGLLWFGDETRREIALTFDDGPHRRDTPRVLDTLTRHDIPATFFLIGKYAEKNPSLIRMIHQSGHQVAIHGYSHSPFPLDTPTGLRAQLERSQRIIGDACGLPPETIRDVRPPFGLFHAKIASLFSEWGYRLVMWNCVPPHWMQPVNWTLTQLLDEVVPGSIIDLHDGKGHGRNIPEILDAVIPKLRADGFEFVTIEQMQNFIKGTSQ
jgi:peptidoglycan/xylan/chitin deacetylase (PgdA/CDA1 family)